MGPACIIMAAGASSRFGSNKLLAPLRGTPVFHGVMDAIDPSDFSSVIVVTGYSAIMEEAVRRGFLVRENSRPELGISRTIRLGLEAAGSCSSALFIAADQPLIAPQTVKKLLFCALQDPSAIWAVSFQGRRGNPCLFPCDLFGELLRLRGDTGGSAVIRQYPDRLRLLDAAGRELLDCDTPEDLSRIECLSQPSKLFDS